MLLRQWAIAQGGRIRRVVPDHLVRVGHGEALLTTTISATTARTRLRVILDLRLRFCSHLHVLVWWSRLDPEDCVSLIASMLLPLPEHSAIIRHRADELVACFNKLLCFLQVSRCSDMVRIISILLAECTGVCWRCSGVLVASAHALSPSFYDTRCFPSSVEDCGDG